MNERDTRAIIAAILIAADRIVGEVYEASRSAHDLTGDWHPRDELTVDEARSQADRLLNGAA